jgi:hypothetical protein
MSIIHQNCKLTVYWSPLLSPCALFLDPHNAVLESLLYVFLSLTPPGYGESSTQPVMDLRKPGRNRNMQVEPGAWRKSPKYNNLIYELILWRHLKIGIFRFCTFPFFSLSTTRRPVNPVIMLFTTAFCEAFNGPALSKRVGNHKF